MIICRHKSNQMKWTVYVSMLYHKLMASNEKWCCFYSKTSMKCVAFVNPASNSNNIKLIIWIGRSHAPPPRAQKMIFTHLVALLAINLRNSRISDCIQLVASAGIHIHFMWTAYSIRFSIIICIFRWGFLLESVPTPTRLTA